MEHPFTSNIYFFIFYLFDVIGSFRLLSANTSLLHLNLSNNRIGAAVTDIGQAMLSVQLCFS